MYLPIDDRSLHPALILASGIASTVLGATNESFPEGTAFFVSISHIAAARHSGEMLRDHLSGMAIRPKGQVQAYGQHIFDPRLGLTWEVKNELPLRESDISLFEVRPVVADEEAANHFQSWAKIWKDRNSPEYPVIRMFPVEDGEPLTFRGFTNVEFTYSAPNDTYGRLQHGVRADGFKGEGKALWQELESGSRIARRLTIDGVAAKGQNSGSAVLDAEGRIVGVVSISPQADYTVVAPFDAGDKGPEGGGRHLSELKLVSDENGAEGAVQVLCDFGIQ